MLTYTWAIIGALVFVFLGYLFAIMVLGFFALMKTSWRKGLMPRLYYGIPFVLLVSLIIYSILQTATGSHKGPEFFS
jgi:hypothetical protein